MLLSSYCYFSYPLIATAPILLLLLLLSSYCYCSFPPIATAPILLLLLLLSSYCYCSFPPIATASIPTDIIPSIVSDPAVVKQISGHFSNLILIFTGLHNTVHLLYITTYLPPPSRLMKLKLLDR